MPSRPTPAAVLACAGGPAVVGHLQAFVVGASYRSWSSCSAAPPRVVVAGRAAEGRLI